VMSATQRAPNFLTSPHSIILGVDYRSHLSQIIQEAECFDGFEVNQKI